MNALIDTDIVFKLGKFEGDKYLVKILNVIPFKVYMHEYIYNNEIVQKGHVKEQLEELVQNSKLTVVGESNLQGDEITDYNNISEKLALEMKADLSKPRDRNVGEVRSLAYAYVKKYRVFMTDDRAARVVANNELQFLDGSKIDIYQLKDIIVLAKESGVFNRKELKQLYTYYANPRITDNPKDKKRLERIFPKLKTDFDNNIWPQ